MSWRVRSVGLPQWYCSRVRSCGLSSAAKGAQAFTLKSLANIFHATARADKMLVTTGLDERLLLHRLVTEIASAAAVPKNKQSASKA